MLHKSWQCCNLSEISHDQMNEKHNTQQHKIEQKAYTSNTISKTKKVEENTNKKIVVSINAESEREKKEDTNNQTKIILACYS